MASRRMDRESNGPTRRTIRYSNGDVDQPVKKTRMERETTPANEQYRMVTFAKPKSWDGEKPVQHKDVVKNSMKKSMPKVVKKLPKRNRMDSREYLEKVFKESSRKR